MASIFSRLFRLGKAEAHSVVDKLEDPIKMTEQGIRDLQKDLTEGMKAMAETKAISIQMKREMEEKKQIAADYEKKAIMLLQKLESGELDPASADRLASEALTKKEQAMTRSAELAKNVVHQEKMIGQFEVNIQKLKSQISSWQNELTTLKARSKIASSTKKLNQQMAKVDSSGTISMLEKMRTKVSEDEALAQSYGEIASIETGVDAEIEKALGGSQVSSGSSALMELKAKMARKKSEHPPLEI